MPEYLEDPSVLTKEKLKIELLANNVVLPNGDQRKDVYVQLYLKNLTVQNKKIPSSDTFSSDEELQPPPVAYIKSHSGRKATRKTDKPRPEDLDVTGLTIEGLKDELLKYGVKAGPIVASTRKLYEKRLQKLLDQGPPGAVAPPPAITQVDSNHNGNSDSDRFSDKEDEVTTVPEPEPVPVVERTIRSRGKIPTPVTTRTRSSQHHQINDPDDDDDDEQDWPLLNVKRRSRRSTHKVDQLVPASDDTDVSELSAADLVLPSPRAVKSKSPLPPGVRKDSRPSSKLSPLLQTQSKNAVVEQLALTPRAQSTSSSMTLLPMCCDEDGISPNSELASLLNTAVIEEPVQSVRASLGHSMVYMKQVSVDLQQEVCPTPQAKPSSLTASRQVWKEQLDSLSSLSAHFDCLSNRFPRTHTQVPTIVSEQDQHESKDDLQYRGRQQKKTQNLSSVTPVKGQSSVFTISKEPWVEKIAAGEQTPNRLDEKDLLKQMFPYETDTPTGINATCRRPIRGAAGRPVKSSDLWTDETLLRSASNSYTESHTSTVHRVTTLPPSSRLLTLAPPPTGKAVAPRRGLPVWLQLLLLSVVAGFIFFVYQTMEANPLNPFRAADSAKAVDHDQ
ncbi:hypothetical protein UPYG_G00344370 [Umbra pygmaea]|uniref:Lamina-associated polypeptide 2 n=1 Tax=Umbra pygmaea TaxID=75934 RepID=A0ABD0VXG7_UMBPY